MAKPLILVSNDDGITSKGIRVLVEAVQCIGEVIVVAPNSPQSGMGHAITIGDTIKLEKSSVFDKDKIDAYECSGTPADCIKIAKHFVLKDRTPDLVVSGVNHGSNTSISVLYSGTMSAAIEGALEGYPAIGFSLCDFSSNSDFTHTIPYIKRLVKEALKKGIPKGVALNINFPPIQSQPIQGIKVCKQADAKWQEEFVERYDPYGRRYFWMAGNFVNFDKDNNNDVWAIGQNYISVVPCQYDLTNKLAIDQLSKKWDLSPETN